MPMRSLRHALTLATVAAALAGGCNLNRFTVNTTSGVLDYGSVAMDREADLEFARLAFPASLKTLETFLISAPDNRAILLLLARGYNSYAFGFVEGDLERAKLVGPEERISELERNAKIHYLRGSEYGFRWLNKPELRKAAETDDVDKLEAELKKLKKDDMPGLFWAAYGWASAINLALDDPDMVASLGVVEKLMGRVLELTPDYNAGAPWLFHGVLHASRPVAFGGDPEKSKGYFESAMKEHGTTNLLVPFLYARFYCVQTQNKKLFDELVGKVLTADFSKHPDNRLMNEIARDRARFWAAHVDEVIME
jgi:hypothetical protein